jgi:hypothetical protein
MAEANAAGSTTLPALSPLRDSNPPTSSTAPAGIDRSRLMTRAHLVARRFRDVMPTYRAALSYALKTIWADVKARAENRKRFAGYVPRLLTPEHRAASELATRRCGSSYMPF